MTASKDGSDFSKLVEVSIGVERCLADENKNKNVMEDPCIQSTGCMWGGKERVEHRRFVRGFL